MEHRALMKSERGIKPLKTFRNNHACYDEEVGGERIW